MEQLRLYTEIPDNDSTVEVDEKAMDLSVQISQSYRLLISDAVHIAVMKTQDIVNLVSSDSDFERVT
jgi:predicted nucleic acid-binding protein